MEFLVNAAKIIVSVMVVGLAGFGLLAWFAGVISNDIRRYRNRRKRARFG